ncbi:amino acid permease [Fervidibacter sacchari]|uniref:Amino acid transporter n=1 Tax=Candidatus Fervidibacter sacchari TaxID=1448929 RepID=A0ABT2ENY1_9BACT|nr:amino acid permease [Candidatus Fervidibacter sacchari]MCS3919641.1 amino acid transporter [Candidatus Fervidibacter sacchari]WKU15358.1 amino acid permease [Candidatus Fervidibacter sacchari]
MAEKVAAPKPTLSVADAVAIIVGIVIGSGIFKTPSLVAANTANEFMFLLGWLLGGIISLIGALCYAELATTYPHAGGEYHFLNRSFGRDIAFLFAWARATVIQTGSIAMLGFVFGDYASELFPLGEHSSAIYAALATIVLTVLNVMGVQQGKWTQNILTAAKVLGLLLVFAVGLLKAVPSEPIPTPDRSPSGAFGLAMIFVLLTYGGWNEAAYISAELKDVRRNMLRALMLSIGAITVIYLLVNFAYLKGLGLAAMAKSEVVAADLLRNAWGDLGAKFISVLIAISALGAMNATIFTGARTNYAWGQDFKALRLLGVWHEQASTPVNALVVQGLISLGLVALGAATRKGFSTMVDYTAPVFWFFFLLTGLSLFILRNTDAETQRPFHTPLYPLTPLLFCVFCVYMLQSSLSYTGVGALVGVAVLLVGIPVLMLVRQYE